MINFFHTFNPQSVAVQFGWLSIYWYGIFIVLGIVVGLIIVLKLARRTGVDSAEVYNLSFYLIIFSIVGARIYAVFLNLPFYLANPFEIVAVWHGGLAIHGAIIGGVLTLLVYVFRKKQNFWVLADIFAPAVALGQAIGRWGNYFNQEVFGRPTDLPWGIPIELRNRPLEFLNFQYFHPTFLYESFLNLINFFVLLFLFSRLAGKNRKSEIREKRVGLIFLIYLVNYSLIRIVMEFFRIDATPLVFGVRLPIIVSGAVIVLSLVISYIKKSLGLKQRD